jgi:hypothetical protein
MAASMDYCHNDDLGLLYSEVYSERKARHQHTSCIAMNHRVCQRLFGNEMERRKGFIQEFVPETFALLLVP